MKLLIVALTMVVSQTAFADDFYCTLTNGFNVATDIAPYRTNKALVIERPFKCEGRINAEGLTVVRISSTEAEDSKTSSARGTARVEMVGLDIHGDGQDTGVCECGLQ
jgi:hypothetical protein